MQLKNKQKQLKVDSKKKSQTWLKNQSPICFQKIIYLKRLYMNQTELKEQNKKLIEMIQFIKQVIEK